MTSLLCKSFIASSTASGLCFFIAATSLLARVHTFSEKCDIFCASMQVSVRIVKTSKNASNELVASYISPDTLHEAV